MNEETARYILGTNIQPDNSLDYKHPHGEGQISDWISWWTSDREVSLDGKYSIEQLEAIIWWMKRYGPQP